MRVLTSFIVLSSLVLPSAAAADSTGGASYPGQAQHNGGGSSHSGSQASETRAPAPTTPSGQSETPAAATPPSPGKAVLLPNGKARPPAGAPAAVRRAIRLGNRLQGKPYRFGGGHAVWEDTGYDCSGASSYVLRGTGGLRSPLNSSGFMRWGVAGPGRWITTYANPEHMFVVIAGLRLDTGSAGQRGPLWRTSPRPPGSFTARHPSGL